MLFLFFDVILIEVITAPDTARIDTHIMILSPVFGFLDLSIVNVVLAVPSVKLTTTSWVPSANLSK